MAAMEDGGWPTNTYVYMFYNGITTSENYPYTSGKTYSSGPCKAAVGTRVPYHVYGLRYASGCSGKLI